MLSTSAAGSPVIGSVPNWPFVQSHSKGQLVFGLEGNNIIDSPIAASMDDKGTPLSFHVIQNERCAPSIDIKAFLSMT